MKKSVFTIVSAMTLLTVTSSTYATNVTCPSLNVLKKASFERAVFIDDPFIWELASNTFTHSGINWNVTLIAKLDNATNPSKAIYKAHHFINHLPVNTLPVPKIDGRDTVCDYSPEDSHYFLFAVSPPEYGFATRYASLLKKSS